MMDPTPSTPVGASSPAPVSVEASSIPPSSPPAPALTSPPLTVPPSSLRSLRSMSLQSPNTDDTTSFTFTLPFPDFCLRNESRPPDNDAKSTFIELLKTVTGIATATATATDTPPPPPNDSPKSPPITLISLTCSNSYVSETETLSAVQKLQSPKSSPTKPKVLYRGGSAPSSSFFSSTPTEPSADDTWSEQRALRIVPALPESERKMVVPLTIFKNNNTTEYPTKTLSQNPFFKHVLSLAEAHSNTTARPSTLHIILPNHKLLRAFTIALQEMSAPHDTATLELDGMNVFEVLACAALLSTKQLQVRRAERSGGKRSGGKRSGGKRSEATS